MNTHQNTNALTIPQRIDAVASQAMAVFGTPDSFEKELAVAVSMQDLRALLTPEIMKPIMSLMNSDIGFQTDRNPTRKDKNGNYPTPYSVEAVRDAVIEAKLRGFHVVGNEMNIIAGKFYATKNGLRRKVVTWPGMTDLKDLYDVPRTMNGGAICHCSATWKKDGIPDSIECDIAIRVNEYMGTDGIVGKAERKLMKRIHDRISGTNTPEAEVDDEPRQIESKPAGPSFSAPEPPAAKPESKAPPVEQPEKKTPQIELAELCEARGLTFEHFRTWAEGAGFVEGTDSISCFGELKSSDAERCIKNQKAMLSGMLSIKGAK